MCLINVIYAQIKFVLYVTIVDHSEETIIHYLFKCKFASQIWAKSDFRDMLRDPPNSSFEDMWKWVSGKTNKEQRCTFASLALAAWFYRNKVVFESAILEPMVVAKDFVKHNEDYIKYNAKVGMMVKSHSFPSSVSWIPPPTNCVKVNVDARVSRENGVSFGAVIRGTNGQMFCAAVKRIKSRWS